MTWIDIVLIIALIVLTIHGIIIGLVRGLFDIVGIVLGYLVAVNYCESMRIPKFLSFLLIFIVVVIIVSLIGRVVSRLIHITPLAWIDRILGGILGILKGVVLGFVFLIIILLLGKYNIALYKSEIAPWLLRGGLTASQLLPEKWYHWIEELITNRQLVQHYYEDYHLSL